LRASFWIPATLSLLGSLVALGALREDSTRGYVLVFGVLMALYGLGAWGVLAGKLHAPGGETTVLAAIVVVGVLLRGIALFAPQGLSTDVYRYVWDGRVQAAAINPYRFIPIDPALAPLRDDSIYPNINHEYAHTIYPPAAQLLFLAVERINDSVLAMKLAMLAFDGISIACLIALLRRYALPTTRVLLYAWHPLPIWEFGGAGHVDAIAIALLLVSFLGASRRAPVWTGIALAAASLIKYYPVVVAPALFRRWDWHMPLAFALSVVVLYLPYLSVGSGVSGFMSGYVNEEGLNSGSGFWLVSLLQNAAHLSPVAARWFVPLSAAIMIMASAWIQLRGTDGPRDPIAASFLLASLFMLLFSPHYPWYFAWLVPFLCFRFSIAHVWLTGACALLYIRPPPNTGIGVTSLIFAPFLLLWICQELLSRRSTFAVPETLHANRSARPASLF
jgi:hypothetical protein